MRCDGSSRILPRARVVLEVGTHSPWISRLLEDLGHEVKRYPETRRLRQIAGVGPMTALCRIERDSRTDVAWVRTGLQAAPARLR